MDKTALYGALMMKMSMSEFLSIATAAKRADDALMMITDTLARARGES